MAMGMDSFVLLWQGLAWPLLRLLLFISLGLAVAHFIEALNWTAKMSRLARPISRLGHLSDEVGLSFSMAFFSGIAANSMLAAAYDGGKIAKKELICANLFNSLPTYFLHLPTMFFITVPLIKGAAFVYVGLTFFAAVLRTVLTLGLSRLILSGTKARDELDLPCQQGNSFKESLVITWVRFQKRMKKIVFFTVPIYTIVFLLNQAGGFAWLEGRMAHYLPALSWLNPQSLGIIAFHVMAEFTAGITMAGALLADGGLSEREVVLALLVGNILSSPVRAVRHQFPYYAGIFSPRLAVELIIYNQSFRLASITLVTIAYYL